MKKEWGDYKRVTLMLSERFKIYVLILIRKRRNEMEGKRINSKNLIIQIENEIMDNAYILKHIKCK